MHTIHAAPPGVLVRGGASTRPRLASLRVLESAAARPRAPASGVMSVLVSTNHVAMVSHPDDVVQLIETAAETMPTAS